MTTDEKLDLVLAKLAELEMRVHSLQTKVNYPMTPNYPSYPQYPQYPVITWC